MKKILFPEHPARPDLMGGKAAALAALHGCALPIPPWFVLTPMAFLSSLTEDQRARWRTATDFVSLRNIVTEVEPAASIRAELEAALDQVCADGVLVAVRSSAVDEDEAQSSFAGQLESFLFVHPDTVADMVSAVWRSAFSERVLRYRQGRGLPLRPQPPAVLVQRMVNAEFSGVAFGADPVTGRRSMAVVSAIYGLGTALVSGASDADTYHVDRNGIIVQRDVAHKVLMHGFNPMNEVGVSAMVVPDEYGHQPVLTDVQIRAVADLVGQTSRQFNRPQDIEWAIEDGRLYLLQSRPITTQAERADPDGVRAVWDNTNLVESYGGITTPLTFSFARRAYEEVYRAFSRIMGVPEATIAAHDAQYGAMIGLIQGRMYYNLVNWHRLTTMLPGAKVNWGFLALMLGLKETLPDDVLADLDPPTRNERLKDGLRLVQALCALIRCHFTMRRRIDAFYARVEVALTPPEPSLEALRTDELAAYYRNLERRLLKQWDAPVVNDFFAMVFYGLLRKLSKRWLTGVGNLHNDLLCGEGGMISTEPARRVCEMADLVAADPKLAACLVSGKLDDIRVAVDAHPAFKSCYLDYLERFGDRCLDELKLESQTLHDDPLILLHAVGQQARRIRAGHILRPEYVEGSLRGSAERRVADAFKRHPIRRLVYGWVLKHARARVQGRENLRFERTRAFGMARRVFLEIGRRFFADGILDDPRDIFYLEVHEILGFVEGTATTSNLSGLAALRKVNFQQYAAAGPAARFETLGAVNQGNTFQATAPIEPISYSADKLRGIACCPGRVRGPVRVVTDPRALVLKAGEILVAEHTDPGWIMLFPACAGLLVERGSLLSHAAIVSREMGIPSIVSLTGVTAWLRDGDWVEMDGATGIIHRVEPDDVKAVELKLAG